MCILQAQRIAPKIYFFKIPDTRNTRWFWKKIGYGSGTAKNYRVGSGIGYPSVTGYIRAILHSCNVLFVPLIFCNSLSVWKSGLTRLTIACCIHMCLLVQVSQSHTTSQATNPREAKWLHWMASCVGIIIVMSLVYSPRPWVTSAHNSVTLHTEGESFCQNTSHRLICFASSNNETYHNMGIPILEYNQL